MDKEEVFELSAHTINMALECTFKYWLYKSGRACPIENTQYIAAGQAVHQFMEDLSNGTVQEDKYYLDAEYILEESRDWERKYEYVVPEHMYPRYFTCKENGCNWFNGRPFDVEAGFNKTIITPKGRHVRLRGRIDAQDEKEVYDWKTGSKVIGNKDYLRQAHIYDFATDFKKKVKFLSLLTGETLEIRHSKKYVPALCDEAIDAITGEMPFRRDDRHKSFTCQNFCENYKTYCSRGKEYILIE